jgi:hypothetical protein
MAMARPKPQSPILGYWNIISLSNWDEDYVNEEVRAFIEFDNRRCGLFPFSDVRGNIDCRTTSREGKPVVEFSWEGGDGDDGPPLTGRGWAILEKNKLHGMIFIHQGDESDFEVEREVVEGD